jgi:hypothetical protein
LELTNSREHRQSFPALSHEQVYGAVPFYLANRDETDGYLQKRRIDYENRRKASRENDPMFYQKMADALRKNQVTTRWGEASTANQPWTR